MASNWMGDHQWIQNGQNTCPYSSRCTDGRKTQSINKPFHYKLPFDQVMAMWMNAQGHVTTGCGIPYFYRLGQIQLCGYRFWNQFSISFHSQDIPIFQVWNRSRDYYPGHVTAGTGWRCVHWIEQVQFSGCRFLNRVSMLFCSQDIAFTYILIFHVWIGHVTSIRVTWPPEVDDDAFIG